MAVSILQYFIPILWRKGARVRSIVQRISSNRKAAHRNKIVPMRNDRIAVR